ncbi:fingers domain of DNA polymerase lambda-domain-containing protein [Xylaria sp. FL0064]|nr:fingers domain of DNA polymerase lambda-domain-containing protein [Xylaria sp. FL0064]
MVAAPLYQSTRPSTISFSRSCYFNAFYSQLSWKPIAAMCGHPQMLSNYLKHAGSAFCLEFRGDYRNEPSREALKIFCNVYYGVGVPTAKRWVDLGYRTLNDLRTKAMLTTNQQLGVEHYDDLHRKTRFRTRAASYRV